MERGDEAGTLCGARSDASLRLRSAGDRHKCHAHHPSRCLQRSVSIASLSIMGLVDAAHARHYALLMSTFQITEAALSLPLPERVTLAQRLWEIAFSDDEVGAGQKVDDPLLEVIGRRAAELDSGSVTAVPHERVMAEARRALE